MNLFEGELVRLVMDDPKTLAEANTRWTADTEYWRLLTSDPSRRFSLKSGIEWHEKQQDLGKSDGFSFSIRTLQDDRLIGFVELAEISWANGEGWVGIGIGERDAWGKGFGTDALRILLRFAFTELNLYRVSLDVFEYNPRARRSYEKAGFTFEGKIRGFLLRENRRWDLIFMGILREEWEFLLDDGNRMANS